MQKQKQNEIRHPKKRFYCVESYKSKLIQCKTSNLVCLQTRIMVSLISKALKCKLKSVKNLFYKLTLSLGQSMFFGLPYLWMLSKLFSIKKHKDQLKNWSALKRKKSENFVLFLPKFVFIFFIMNLTVLVILVN